MAPTFPGFMIPSGSIARLIVFISPTVPSPSSSTKNSFFPIPTPCSPVPGTRCVKLQSEGKDGDEQRVRGRRIFTGSVEGESALDHAMHETAHVVEFFIRLEKKESVKISCGIDRHSLALSEGYKFAPWLSARIIIHHPLHGQ